MHLNGNNSFCITRYRWIAGIVPWARRYCCVGNTRSAGMISPAQFIPLAEETGHIVAIGLWVLQTACAQLKAWQSDALTRDLTLAVNVSARQFRSPDFVAQVQRTLLATGAKPGLLKLELTESIVLENVEDTIAKMRELKLMGVSFSMDDFGTGYSSLQYLKRLPLDQIKIDQSFVRDIVKRSSTMPPSCRPSSR